MLWTLLLTSLIAHQMLMIADSKDAADSMEPTTNTDLCGEKILVDLQKPFTNQSSNFINTEQNITLSSEKAIDGNKLTCAHSKKGGPHFWTIDLKNVFNISCFCIYNEGQNNIDMTNAEIIIGNRSITIGSFKGGQNNCFHLPKGELARNITVKKNNNNDQAYPSDFLVLCEVTIWSQASPFVLITEKKTWEHALYYCREHHMDLASILDEQDQAWAEAEVREANTPYVWLGLRYTCTLGFWFWIQSHSLGYNNFANSAKIEECDMSVAMNKADGKWYTEPDNLTYNFICTK